MAWKKGGGRKAPRGVGVRGTGGRRPRRVRSNGWQWSEEAEEVFFDALAASANVSLAADEAGFSTPTVYRLRQRRPDFEAKWQAALAQGYARLEAAVLRAAADSMEGLEFDGDRPIPRMTVEQAMNVLRAHRCELRDSSATGRGPGRARRPVPIDEVRESILRKLAAIAAAGEGEVPAAYRERPATFHDVAPAEAGAHALEDESRGRLDRRGSQPSLG